MVKGEDVLDTTRYGDTINDRAVRILLECILVLCFTFTLQLMWELKTETIKLNGLFPLPYYADTMGNRS